MTTLRLGDTAPDFSQNTTAGAIRVYEGASDLRAVGVSRPANFTPVRITALGRSAKRPLWPQSSPIAMPSIAQRVPKGFSAVRPDLRTTLQPNP